MHATHNQTGSHPTPADTLRQAAEYLAQYGWIQHRYYASLESATPAACTLGALYIVTHGEPSSEPYADVFDEAGQPDAYVEFMNAEFSLSLHLGLYQPGSPLTTVHDWNDDAQRTQSEVIQTLLNAATDLDAVGGAR